VDETARLVEPLRSAPLPRGVSTASARTAGGFLWIADTFGWSAFYQAASAHRRAIQPVASGDGSSNT
jgi:hypothetical protein